MLIKIIKGSIFKNKLQKSLAFLTCFLATALLCAMLNITLGIGNEVAKQLRSYGANILVVPQGANLAVEVGGEVFEPLKDKSYLREADLHYIKEIFWRNNIVGFAPFLEGRVAIAAGTANSAGTAAGAKSGANSNLGVAGTANSAGDDSALIVGTYFNKEVKIADEEDFFTGISVIYPLIEVEGEWARDDATDEIMVGAEFAAAHGLKVGDRVVLRGVDVGAGGGGAGIGTDGAENSANSNLASADGANLNSNNANGANNNPNSNLPNADGANANIAAAHADTHHATTATTHIAATTKPATAHSVRIVGILKNSEKFDHKIIASLKLAQILLDKRGFFASAEVSALTIPENDLAQKARRDVSSLNQLEYDTWYCTAYVSSIAYQIEEDFKGTSAKPQTAISEAESLVIGKIQSLMAATAVICLVVASIAIASLISSDIHRRKREIGLLKALGARSEQIYLIFVAENLFIALVAALAGFGAGLGLSELIALNIFGYTIPVSLIALPLCLANAAVIVIAGCAFVIKEIVNLLPVQVLYGK